MWVNWSHEHGFLTRNEAHGSPGNWLDLYAARRHPETEMFHNDRNKLISKFASSAAHVTGQPLVVAPRPAPGSRNISPRRWPT